MYALLDCFEKQVQCILVPSSVIDHASLLISRCPSVSDSIAGQSIPLDLRVKQYSGRKALVFCQTYQISTEEMRP